MSVRHDERGRPQLAQISLRASNERAGVMTWFLRSVALVALGVVLGMTLWQLLFSTGSQAPAVAAGGNGTNAASDASLDPSQDAIPGILPGGLGGDLSSNSVPADDVDSSSLKHPLTRSLGQMIEGNRELFDQLGAQGLGDSLAEADALLWETKQSNQNALREANRQVRIAGNSPNVVLVVIEGLQWNPEQGLEPFAAAMPALYRIAGQGRYASLTAGLTADEQRLRLTTGSSATGGTDRSASTFSRAFWNSGYGTALVGDAWWWGASDSSADWDAWVGFPREQVAKPFPAKVWSNGQPITLTANADGKQAVAATELFAYETLSYVQRHRRGRPFALVVSLGQSVQPQPSNDDTDSLPEVCTKADELLNELDIRLNQLQLTENTLLLVLGVSSSGDASASGQAPLLVVRDLRRVPGDGPLPATVGYEDILPTLLHATGSQRIPPAMSGRSQWQAWTAKPAAKQAL
jgi:hypothetical protein